MKVMVLGARGLLGAAIVFALRRRGIETIPVSRKEFDPLRDDLETLRIGGADFVVNAMGVTPRRKETEGAREALNERFPRVMADRCVEFSAPFIHISTDAVFAPRPVSKSPATNVWRNENLRRESDPPDARDPYGISKAEGEPVNGLTVRGSFIGPELAHNDGLLSWFLRAKKPVSGFTNVLWNGMTSLQFAECVRLIIERGAYFPGVRHVFGEDVTKCGLLRRIAAAFELPGVGVVENESAKTGDMRLGTIYPEFLMTMAVPPLEEQLTELRRLSDDSGNWRNAPELRDIQSA